ncbi:hypothetical protein Tco_1340329, partial [Tanacetum coccineum]
AKIKTLDALPSLLSKVTEVLDRFTQVIEQASHKASDQGVPSTGQEDKEKKAISSKDAKEEGTESESDDTNLTVDQIKEQKKLEELAKADMAKQEVELGKKELVDLLRIDIVKGFYKA